MNLRVSQKNVFLIKTKNRALFKVTNKTENEQVVNECLFDQCSHERMRFLFICILVNRIRFDLQNPRVARDPNSSGSSWTVLPLMYFGQQKRLIYDINIYTLY